MFVQRDVASLSSSDCLTRCGMVIESMRWSVSQRAACAPGRGARSRRCQGRTSGLHRSARHGTPVGDPIEIEALTEVYGKGEKNTCALGASKTNLGHMEAAAGMGGLIKTVLCLRHGQIPANILFRELNPGIVLDGTRFFIPTELTRWPLASEPRRAAVSSFGFSGTSAHAVVEQASPARAVRTVQRANHLFLLSHQSAAGLRANAGRLAEWLSLSPGEPAPLGDVAYTLARRRTHHRTRLALVAGDHAELVGALRAAAAGDPIGDVLADSARRPDCPGVVFVFSGNGSGWTGMGRQLLRDEPVFAAELGFSLRGFLETESSFPDAPTDRTQPVTFAMQVGLARLWRHYGVRPGAVLGHSMGELAAALVAGAIDLLDAARVACRRAQLIEDRLGGSGLAALVGLDVDAVERRLAGHPDLSVAVHSSPSSTVVSGPVTAIESFVARLRGEDIVAEVVGSVNFAAHSRAVDPLVPLFEDALAELKPGTPQLLMYSTTLSDPRSIGVIDSRYWAANIRNTLRFIEAVGAAAGDGFSTFVEVAPHPIVARSVRETLEQLGVEDSTVLTSTRRGRSESGELLANLGRLYCTGDEVDWRALYPQGNLVDLPPVAWQRKEHWLPAATSESATTVGEHPLLGRHLRMPGTPEQHVWQTEISCDRLSWLAGHGTADMVTMPSGGYCELAIAAACQAFGTEPAGVTVHTVRFHNVLVLNEPVTITTRLTVERPGEGSIIVTTGADRVVEHATIRVQAREPATLDFPAAVDLRLYEQATTSPEQIYDRMAAMGVRYDGGWKAVSECADLNASSPGEAAGWLRLPGKYRRGSRHLRLHPVLFDGCIQVPRTDRPTPTMPMRDPTTRTTEQVDNTFQGTPGVMGLQYSLTGLEITTYEISVFRLRVTVQNFEHAANLSVAGNSGEVVRTQNLQQPAPRWELFVNLRPTLDQPSPR
jgi:acyl transferase domain-containing protein